MSYYFTLNYPQNHKPCTVNEVLRQLLVPRKWRHYLRIEKQILINGCYHHFNQLVYPGDKIELVLNHVESDQGEYLPSKKMPEVIYENNDLLVINKPAGQKTHPNLDETDTALNDCATYLKRPPFIVHRLDKLTSGLLLVAKNPAVVPILNRELTTKVFHREYLALVSHNENLKEKGTVDLPIGRDPKDQRKRIIRPDGLKSITHYQIVQKNSDNTALVKLTLGTGRTHQIRVHLAAIGCPIVGDPLYNPDFQNGEFLHLTACQMTFLQPFSFTKVQVKLPKEENKF